VASPNVTSRSFHVQPLAITSGQLSNTSSVPSSLSPEVLSSTSAGGPQAQALQFIEPFVDADTAATFLGITRRTLLQKVRAGKIPGHPLDPGAQKKEWRFKLSELDRYLCSAVNSVLQPPEPANRRI
jgi:excisionase family DNA binding protein